MTMKAQTFYVFCAVLFAFLIIWFMVTVSGDEVAHDTAKQACLDAGYHQVETVLGEHYCIRFVNGNTEVVPLKEIDQ